jgi:hypothetical protein
MDYNNAIKYIEDHWNLVGTTTEKGLKIGKLIIVPSNEKSRERFFSSYLISNDENSAILPFISMPVEVWAIDVDYLYRNNVLFYKKLV